MNSNTVEDNKKDKFLVKVLKELLKKDENGKNFIEFVIEIEKESTIWKINRKLSHFVLLNKNVKYNHNTISYG